MAEFEDPTTLVAATHRAHLEGYRRMDAYSPFPIEELHEALGSPETRLPLIVLIGGLVGCIGGYGLQYWVATVAYPLNIGGKPLNSWPAFIPITFECTILAAALAAVLGMLALNTPCSTCHASPWRAAIGSSCASKRRTRSSAWRRRGGSWRRSVRAR
jgi:ActD protein